MAFRDVVRLVIWLVIVAWSDPVCGSKAAERAGPNTLQVCSAIKQATLCTSHPDCRWEINLSFLPLSTRRLSEGKTDGKQKHIPVTALTSSPKPVNNSSNARPEVQTRSSPPENLANPTSKLSSPSEPSHLPIRLPSNELLPLSPSPTGTPSEIQSSVPAAYHPSWQTVSSPVARTGVPTRKQPQAAVSACLAKCSTYSARNDCPSRLGCAWQGNRCIQVRGGQTHPPTNSPLPRCRQISNKKYATSGFNLLEFGPLSGSRMSATAFQSNHAYLFSTQELQGAHIELLTLLEGHNNIVVRTRFSADEAIVGTCSMDRTARLFDSMDGRLVSVLTGAHTGGVVDIAFPTVVGSKIVATASHDSTAAVWTISNGTLLQRLIGHDAPISGVRFFPGSETRLFTGSYDGLAFEWNIESGRVVQNISHSGPIFLMELTENGQTLALASDVISIWDIPTRTKQFQLSGPNDIVRTLQFSKDNTLLLTLSADDHPMLWNLATGRPISVLGQESVIFAVAFTTNGRILTGGEAGLDIWSPVGAGPYLESSLSTPIWSLGFQPLAEHIVSGAFDGSLAVISCA